MSTESPISITYSLTDPNGFPILLTFRSDDPKILMSELLEKSNWLKSHNYLPQVKKSFGGGEKKPIEYVKDKVCPKCGKPLIVVNNEKIISKCSDNKWNPITKKGEPCDYVEWRDKR